MLIEHTRLPHKTTAVFDPIIIGNESKGPINGDAINAVGVNSNGTFFGTAKIDNTDPDNNKSVTVFSKVSGNWFLRSPVTFPLRMEDPLIEITPTAELMFVGFARTTSGITGSYSCSYSAGTNLYTKLARTVAGNVVQACYSVDGNKVFVLLRVSDTSSTVRCYGINTSGNWAALGTFTPSNKFAYLQTNSTFSEIIIAGSPVNTLRRATHSGTAFAEVSASSTLTASEFEVGALCGDNAFTTIAYKYSSSVVRVNNYINIGNASETPTVQTILPNENIVGDVAIVCMGKTNNKTLVIGYYLDMGTTRRMRYAVYKKATDLFEYKGSFEVFKASQTVTGIYNKMRISDDGSTAIFIDDDGTVGSKSSYIVDINTLF